MSIRFKCPHCQKPLSVKDHLAGKKAACPVCKKSMTIPTPVPEPAAVDVDALVAEAFADKPVEKAPVATQFVEFTCPFCDEELKLSADLAGKKTPCPACTKVISVPQIKVEKPKDWRTSQRTGPSAALVNQPEAPTDAWSTSQKSKVSREAMEEAGALPEDEEPVSVGKWIKRGVWMCVILIIAFFGFKMFTRARHESRESNYLEQAKKSLDKLPPLHQAEIHRAEGELYVRNGRAGDAIQPFAIARALAADEKDRTLENDLFLIKIVLSQIEMGGSGDDTLVQSVKVRYDWNDNELLRELQKTLQEIRAPEAKATALRELTCQLIGKNKLEVAVGLTAGLANVTPALKAQQVAMYLVTKDDKKANELIPLPEPDKGIGDASARLAYTLGHAYLRDYPAALKVASAKGAPAGRLEACIAGAAIALAEGKGAETKPFFEAAFKAHEDDKEAKDKAPSWALMELVRLAGRADFSSQAKGIADKLPAPYRQRAQLDILQGQLDNSNKAVDVSRLEEFGDPKEPTFALAWEALARHNARLGSTSALNVESLDEQIRPLVYVGLALGEQDRQK